MSEPYEALLVLSFGGPNGPADVMPFLRNVTRGRGIPEQRLAEVAEHYQHFGGVSPINSQNLALIDALRARLPHFGIDLPIYFGNRNWDPFVTDTLRAMRADGITRALAFATSATSSFSGCRQYRLDIAAAQEAVGPGAPAVDKIRHYFNHPGFVAANADGVRAALASLPEATRDDARLVFTAHSIPNSMDELSGPDRDCLYSREHRETARLVTESVRPPGSPYDLVWQSRSGPPAVPWLEPDINDHLRALAAGGAQAVVVAPTGFVSDHLEVAWDLDTEARDTAAKLGLQFARAATAGTHPAFVDAVCELVAERVHDRAPRLAGTLGLCGVDCPTGCCPAPVRPASGRPAA